MSNEEMSDSNEVMLVEFINKFMNSQMTERDFEDSVLDVRLPDATQTKAFYIEALGMAANLNDDIAQDVLNQLNDSDTNVNQSILNAKVRKDNLADCLRILFEYSKGIESEAQG